jgi:hypothetical protein
MDYGQTSKDLEEEMEEESEKTDKHYRNSLLPHFRFNVRLPNSMKDACGDGFCFKVPDTGNMVAVKNYDSTPYKTKIPKSGKRY